MGCRDCGVVFCLCGRATRSNHIEYHWSISITHLRLEVLDERREYLLPTLAQRRVPMGRASDAPALHFPSLSLRRRELGKDWLVLLFAAGRLIAQQGRLTDAIFHDGRIDRHDFARQHHHGVAAVVVARMILVHVRCFFVGALGCYACFVSSLLFFVC